MELPWERDSLLAAPLFESLWPILRHCPEVRFPGLDDLNALARIRGTRGAVGTVIRFVAVEGRKRSEFESQYEIRVYRDGAVPTRESNWHDLFNALAWITFPRTKAMLNRCHAEEMRLRRCELQRGTARTVSRLCAAVGSNPGSRGAVRDALTLFDESGVIVACAEPALAEMLREFRWTDLFWKHRALVRRAMRFFVFGHAIQEKALRPYKGLTARALVLQVPVHHFALPLEDQLAAIDGLAATRFSDVQVLASTRSLYPLPILGVPGWDPGNERESYYDDASVFRPGRRRSAQE